MDCKLIYRILTLFLFVVTAHTKSIHKWSQIEPNFRVEKQLSPEYKVTWEVYLEENEIYFTVTAKTLGWVGFGISNSETKRPSDVIIGGLKDGLPYFNDYYVTLLSNVPRRDTNADWVFIEVTEENGSTSLSFLRKFDTGDADQDVIIKNAELYILWAYHPSDDLNNPEVIAAHEKHSDQQRGRLRVNLLQDPEASTELPTWEPSRTTEPRTTTDTWWTTQPWTTEPSTTEPRTTTDTWWTTQPWTTEPSTTEPRTTTDTWWTTQPWTTEPRTTTDNWWTTEPWTTETPYTSPTSTEPPHDGFTRTEILSSTFRVTWTVNFVTQYVVFNVTANATGIVGFGLSDYGNMVGADLIIGGAFRSTPYLDDYHSIRAGEPVRDAIQSWTLLTAEESNSQTILVFGRPFDTQDNEDLPILNDWTYFIWTVSDCDNLKHDVNEWRSFAVNILDPRSNFIP